MKNKHSIIRICFGISLTFLVLYYVYVATNLTQDNISTSYISKEDLKKVSTIEKGQSFVIDYHNVEYVDIKNVDEEMELILKTKAEEKFLKVLHDDYSIYGVKDNTIVYNSSNYIKDGKIYLHGLNNADISELVILKNKDELPVIKMRIHQEEQ